jgi:hypothetical protein
MYGYRKALMPFTRVFLPESLARRFQHIHESEQALRDLLDEEGTGRALPVQTVGNLRPTRANILDVGAIAAYRPGQQVYPVEPVHDPSALGDSVGWIDREVRRLFGGTPRFNEFLPITIDDMQGIIQRVRVQPDGGDWDTDGLRQVLSTLSARYGGRAMLYVRPMRRSDATLSQGAISGDEQAEARRKGCPVLLLFKDGEPREPGVRNPWLAPFWYPTVSFPRDMPAMVFNRSA